MTEPAKTRTRTTAAKAAPAKPAANHSTVKADAPRRKKNGSLLKMPKLNRLGKAAALTAGLAGAGAAAIAWQRHHAPSKSTH